MGAAEVIPALPPGFEADPPPPPGFQLDGARPAAPAGPPLRGAAAIPGGEAPRAPEPVDARSPLRRMLDEVHGAVGTLQATVEGVVGGGLGAAGGLIGGLAGAVRTGQYGTQQGAAAVQSAVEGGAHSMTREPRSPEARRNMESVIGPVMQAMAPLTGHMGDLAGAGTAPPARVGELVQPVRDAAGVLRETPVPGVKQAPAGFVAPTIADAKATAAKLALPEQQGITNAVAAGYKVTPKAGGGGKITRAAATAAGNPRLAKELSAHNAENTARLAREDVGLPADVPATPEATIAIRKEAGQDYSAVKDVGRFKNDAQYTSDLDAVVNPIKEAAKDFPDLLDTPLIKRVEGMRREEVSASSAIEVVKDLRNEADKAFRAGDKRLGGAYRALAAAVDNSMDRALGRLAETSGNPELVGAVDKYRAARVRIAKSYLLDDAMDGKPGEVNARVYARALDKGVPLTGPARQIAEFGKQFGDEGLAQKLGKTESPGFTFGDMILAALHVPSMAVGAAALVARPFARAALSSEAGQRIITRKAREAAARAEPVPTEAPPFNPGLEAGFEPPPTQRPPAAPLGDLTPEWETAPGAAPTGRMEVAPAEGLIPAVDEAVPLRPVPGGVDLRTQRTVTPEGPQMPLPVAAPQGIPANVARDAGSQIPAVPGRPDLPDVLHRSAGPEASTTREPAAAAAQQAGVPRIDAANMDPGAVEARRLRAAVRDVLAEAFGGKMSVIEGQPEIPVTMPKAGEIPVGKVIEGQPEIKANVPTKPLPVGEATTLTESGVETQPAIPVGQAKELFVDPKRPEAYNLHDAAWRKEFGLGNDDAVRAAQTRAALEVDAPAVERAAVQYENSPTRFDREVQAIIEKGAEDASQAKQAAEGGEGPAPAATPAVKAGADSAPAPGAERGQAGTAGGQAAPGPQEKLDLLLPKIDEGFMREQERAQAAKRPPANPRGVEAARFALEKGKADKTLDADGVDLALWALEKNPNLANDLRVAVKDAAADGISKGSYNTATALVTLFKGNTNPTTAMHEILHHSERMMPQVVQDGIRREWKFAVEVAMRKAGAEQRAAFRDLQDAMNKGDHQAMGRVHEAVKTGVLDANEMYQLVNPTEFWAVNGARILHERFTGRGTWRAEARQWLKEMIEQVKHIVGLRSDAPVLKVLEEVLNPRKTTGERRSPTMLDGSRGTSLSVVEGVFNTTDSPVRLALNAALVKRAMSRKGEHPPVVVRGKDGFDVVVDGHRVNGAETQAKAQTIADSTDEVFWRGEIQGDPGRWPTWDPPPPP